MATAMATATASQHTAHTRSDSCSRRSSSRSRPDCRCSSYQRGPTPRSRHSSCRSSQPHSHTPPSTGSTGTCTPPDTDTSTSQRCTHRVHCTSSCRKTSSCCTDPPTAASPSLPTHTHPPTASSPHLDGYDQRTSRCGCGYRHTASCTRPTHRPRTAQAHTAACCTRESCSEPRSTGSCHNPTAAETTTRHPCSDGTTPCASTCRHHTSPSTPTSPCPRRGGTDQCTVTCCTAR